MRGKEKQKLKFRQASRYKTAAGLPSELAADISYYRNASKRAKTFHFSSFRPAGTLGSYSAEPVCFACRFNLFGLQLL